MNTTLCLIAKLDIIGKFVWTGMGQFNQMCGHKVSRDEIRFRKRSTTYPHFHKNYYTFQEEKYYEYCVKLWVVN